MAYRKITADDLQGIGVVGLADTPGLSTEDMQAKFEETARSVIIPFFNQFVEDVQDRDTATDTQLSDRYTKSEVDTIAAAKADTADVYVKDEVYTKGQTEALVNERVQEIGSADMMKAVYDTDNTGTVDDADRLGGNLPSYYMPVAGGRFTGGVTVQPGMYIDFLTQSGAKLRILGGGSSDLAVLRVLGTDGSIISEVMMVNTATGEIVSSILMPKSGGTFTGQAFAYSDNRAARDLRNIAVRGSDNVGASTNSILMIRK